jgi:hypothetical protein
MNVNRNCSPIASTPESKRPELDVTVWPTGSRFVQQTVSPTLMFAIAGSKAFPSIDTAMSLD